MTGDDEGGLTLKVGERCRKQFALTIVFLFAFSGLFGVISAGDDVEPRGGMYGGELRIALQGDIEENPLLANDDASLLVVSLMYDSLAKIDRVTLMPTPWVAVNWTLTSNTSVEVKFRTDVEWHDSTDASPHYMTATDICYTYDKMRTTATSHWYDLLQNVVCSETGSDTVEFDLTSAEQARGVFFSKILTIPLIPDGFTGAAESGSGPYKFGTRGTHSFTITNDVVVDRDNATEGQKVAIAGAHYHYIDDSAYDSVDISLSRNNTPIPTGDYDIFWSNGTILFDSALSEDEEVTANYSITNKYTNIVAFERHFSGRPYLDMINYTFFPDDPATADFDEATDGAVKAMIDSLVDFIGFEMASGSENALRWEGGLDQTTLGAEDHTHISVQTTNPKLKLLYLGMNTLLNPLNDTQFRKGLSMAIKRELALTFEANTIVADSMIHSSNSFWHNATCPKFRIQKDEDNQPDLSPIINHFQDNGFLDPDEDGYLEDPTGADFKLSLLVPPTTEDPAKTSIGTQAIGEVYNDVGIETETILLPTDEIRDRIDQDDFSLFLSTVEVEADPIFLYDMFHKDGAKNDVNLDDPFLNDLLDNVRTQLDQDARQYYVKYAVCYIAETAPVGTILHYSVLETYERVNYEGWVPMTGGVNNFWSYMEIHYKQLGPMKAQIILLVDSIKAGEALDVVVSATDLEDVPLSGAWVKVTNDYSSDVTINYTDASGEMSFNWTGPDVSLSTTVTFTATVRIPQYDEAIATNAITVHPEFLKMDVTIGASENELKTGKSTTITVTVEDYLTGAGIPDVTVLITVSPGGAGGTLEQFSGTTNPSGQFQTTFSADITVSMKFNLKATATKEGYQTAESQPKSIYVEPEAGEVAGIGTLIAILILIIILVVIILVLAARRMGAVGGEELEEEELEEEELAEEAEVELE